MTGLKAPFPWFGGKSKVADIVWKHFGDVDNYVEPFAGSLAVLLGRPYPPKVETVNDYDSYLINFWRAVKYAPEEVAEYANWPVNEVDLTARHIWLVNTGKERLERLFGDPDYYDSKVAGWWVWGICSWIGSGWCSGKGPWISVDGRLTRKSKKDEKGVSKKIIHLGDAGQGVNRKLINLNNTGRGVHRKLINLIDGGHGVSRRSLHFDNEDSIYNGVDLGKDKIIQYMNALAERLRYVRIACGDWSRVVTFGALDYGKEVGIFLDPPYSKEECDQDLYNVDIHPKNVYKEVLEWCVKNGNNPRYRIALCGYEGEYNALEDLGWKKYAWKAGRSFGSFNSETKNNENRHKERIWFNQNCLFDNP